MSHQTQDPHSPGRRELVAALAVSCLAPAQSKRLVLREERTFLEIVEGTFEVANT
jgi:hypothetical protein